MTIQVEICYWHQPWPGHIGIKLYDAKQPELGYYVSSETRQVIAKCLHDGTSMDYEDFFQHELVQYGNKCIKMKLPPTRLPLALLEQHTDIFAGEYDLGTNNCAHIAAKILAVFQYFRNTRIADIRYLEPKNLYFAICGQGTSFQPVTAIEYAYSLIKSDLRLLEEFAKDLHARGHDSAVVAVKILTSNINQELMNFALVENKTIQEWQKVQQAIFKIVADAEPTLAEHRGYKKLIGNLVLSILMLGIIYALAILVKGAITGKFLFFSDTKTSAIANRIADNTYKVTEIVSIDSKIDTNQEQKVHFDEKKQEIKI